MAIQKPSIPKGTRDFSPTEVAKRNFIINTIKNAFNTFGFQPIETPSFENYNTLMGKYGEEGDRLIFKILNSGEYIEDISDCLYSFLENIVREEIINRLISPKEENHKNIEKTYLDDALQDIIVMINKEPKVKVFKKDLETFLKEEIDSIKEDIKKSESSLYRFISFCEECSPNERTIHAKPEIQKRTNILLGKVFQSLKSQNLTAQISEKALRYDLTVPFARYVVQHQSELTFPFKRYQIQPVWRADRPQKGRFREFYQCDADVVGSTSLWQEVEFVQLYDTVFTALNLKGVTIKMNNRKILSGFAEMIGESDKLTDFTVALDKLDKIGEEGVIKEMKERGISEEAIAKLQPIFTLKGTVTKKLSALKEILKSSETGMKGVEELEFIAQQIAQLGLQTAILDLDVTLARGLNYYTGAIFEIGAPAGVQMGSIGGGGRYDDLTSIFGLKGISGIGISFGLDRIGLVMEDLNLFPESLNSTVEVLCINFGDAEALQSMKLLKALHQLGKTAELYPDAAKIKKQMEYANKRNIPYVVIIGESELAKGTFVLKNMLEGTQKECSLNEVSNALFQ
nr:histidine--tRNA ligase [uncultured Capnocytophaga sp.]